METLPDRIRSLRKAKGWSAEQLAVYSGVSVSTVNRVECAKLDPSLASLAALAHSLGTTSAALLADDPAVAS